MAIIIINKINSDVAPLQSNHCTEVPLYYCVNVHLPVHPAEDKVDSVLFCST